MTKSFTTSGVPSKVELAGYAVLFSGVLKKKKQDMKLNKVTSRSIRKQYNQIKASSNTLFLTLMLSKSSEKHS